MDKVHRIDGRQTSPPPLSADELRRRFDAAGGLTVGLEEETMLLDPVTFDLVPRAGELLARFDGDARFKPELPAAQLEITTAPAVSPVDAIAQLAAARRDLAAAAAASGLARPAVAAVHPFAAVEGVLSGATRYDIARDEYGVIIRRQLVASLQVHVAVGGAQRTLAVYNALRSFLPELAALAANAPFHAGADSGLASVRPTICEQLPRQGMPPVIESWEQLAADLGWGEAAGAFPHPGAWWWELRPHVAFGTLELRVPDAQTTVHEAAGVVAFAHALVAWLVERHDAGERLPVAPTWRIEENRWSALRHGLDGTMADLADGRALPTRERLAQLIDAVAPTARRHGIEALLNDCTRPLVHANGAIRQREIACDRGLEGLAAWLADRFEDPGP